jgi:hypothetical protein
MLFSRHRHPPPLRRSLRELACHRIIGRKAPTLKELSRDAGWRANTPSQLMTVRPRLHLLRPEMGAALCSRSWQTLSCRSM